MAGTVYHGTYLNGIVLDNPAKQRPVTVTGKISAKTGDAIFGNSALAWTVDNFGTIDATGTSGFGVQLNAGGVVDNAGRRALVTGYGGILFKGAAGAVDNLGTIAATGKNVSSVDLSAGGSVVNGAAGATKARIAGGSHAVRIAGAAGTVVNFGAIANAGTRANVELLAGGAVANGSSASTAARIHSAGTAIYAANGAGVVTNFGTIKGSTGILLLDGGSVSNGASGSAAGLIAATSGNAVAIAGAAGTVANFGTITAAGTTPAVLLEAGGAVVNGAAGAAAALVSGTGSGVYAANGRGTVTNFGTIDAASASQGSGVMLRAGGNVANFGKIESSSGTTSGVYLSGTGVVVNGGKTAPAAAIDGGGNGVAVRGAIASITNFGAIAGAANNGVYLQLGGSVLNQASGIVSGAAAGIVAHNGAATVANYGRITAASAEAKGVALFAGGTLTNGKSGSKEGLISGTEVGVYVKNGTAHVTNFGTIKGATGFLGAGAGNATLTNFGTVESTKGAAGVAVDMAGGTGNGLLIVEQGATFVGRIEGGGSGEIEFVGGGAANVANVSGFATIVLGNGVGHNLTFTDANFAGVAGDTITVFGGNRGNTVDGSRLTSAGETLVIQGGSGTDILKGGLGNDTFVFAADDLLKTDKVTGGGGNDELLLTTPGVIAAGGVSGVETYRLAGGGHNSLVLTNANFAGINGSTITVYCGNRGNTIDGSALSLAANGLVIYAGSGADVLKGGAGNDIFVFAAQALTGTDRILGGGGNNELLMTSAGKIAAAGVSGVETYVLADGGANTLVLTKANFIGTKGSITISDGNGGNTVSAATVPATDRIVVYAGSGVDKLVGGAGGDIFYAGGRTTMTGKTGTNEFIFSAPGHNVVTDFSASITNEIVVSNSGFGLKLSGAGNKPKLLPNGLFVANATGSFTSASQRFAYDTKKGELFFSATGSTRNEQLVVTLTGHPSLAAGQVFFVS
jgi:hypothetical protein